MERAVIDRFEGAYAVLLVGDEQTPLDIPRSTLPTAVHEGDWLRIDLVDGQVTSVTLDQTATDAASRRIQDKLARLRRGEHLRSND